MQIVRLFDPNREPQGWMQIIRPTQFAAFATLVETGSACDADGVPTSADDASCIIFDTLQDADAYCRGRVAQMPHLQFEVLDGAGRRRTPLLTIVHPSRVEALDGSQTKMRRNTYAAIALLLIGPVLIWFDWTFHDGVLVMPTIVGINAVLIALRLVMMNVSSISIERTRRQRVARALDADDTDGGRNGETPD